MNWSYERPPDGGVPLADIVPATPPRRRSRWKLWGAIVAVVAIVVGVSAVLMSSSGGKSAAAILQSAPASTRSAGTARIDSLISLTIDGETHDTARITGAENFGTRQADLEISAAGITENIRTVGGIEYLSQNLVPLPNGAHWVSIDPQKDLGITPVKLGSGDPTSGLDILSAVIGNPQSAGTENVDGIEATRYTFTLDLTDLTARIHNAEDKVGFAQLAEGLQALGHLTDLHHVPGEAWIDSQGRVFRLQFTLALSAGGKSITEVSRLDFSHFGEPVTVATPTDVVPFSQVPDLFSEIAARAQQLAQA